MGEYAESCGRWTANLNPNELVELTFVPNATPLAPLASVSSDNLNLLSYAENQNLDQRLADNRPSGHRIVDLMRSRPDTPVPLHDYLSSPGTYLK